MSCYDGNGRQIYQKNSEGWYAVRDEIRFHLKVLDRRFI